MKTLLLLFALFGLPIGAANAAQPKAACRCGADCKCNRAECGSPDCPSLRTATIVVQLPADAVLLFDGERTASRGIRRVFLSPRLEAGKEYQYRISASVLRNGSPVVVEKNIAIMAGRTTQVTMDLPEVTIEYLRPMYSPTMCVGGR